MQNYSSSQRHIYSCVLNYINRYTWIIEEKNEILIESQKEVIYINTKME